ncbi:MAG: N-acetylmuramic acid 6-phosphate etherase [Chitinophagales bacterium]
MQKITEAPSKYRHLDKMTTKELLININQEDKIVPMIIEALIPQLEQLVDVVVDKMKQGGRLFYIGAGTSGRLGVLDAAECPPTFGVSPNVIIGIIAGGKRALTQAVEFAEDDFEMGWHDLELHQINAKDMVVGIAASGTTPYVVGALKQCQQNKITTACIVCNENSLLANHADHIIEAVVGPEFVTGSTRMKAGTTQKLLLNMLSTSVMIKLGRVKDNRMVDMQLSNQKLVDRGISMLIETLKVDATLAKKLLLQYGSVRKVIESRSL